MYTYEASQFENYTKSKQMERLKLFLNTPISKRQPKTCMDNNVEYWSP